jgi:tetratricopeptide (TPR) repeat protein
MKPVSTFVVVLLCFALAAPNAGADDIAEAREHYRKGSKAYDLGHYQDAIREYEAAYTIKDDPALLFNIAQAYRLAGDYPNAIRSYKSFAGRQLDGSKAATGARGRATDHTATSTDRDAERRRRSC